MANITKCSQSLPVHFNEGEVAGPVRGAGRLDFLHTAKSTEQLPDS